MFIQGNVSTAVKGNVHVVTKGKGEFYWTENGVKTEESSYAVANQNLDTKRNVSADVAGYEVDAGVKKKCFSWKNLAKHSLRCMDFVEIFNIILNLSITCFSHFSGC